MSKTAIYPGTFDPITFGHIDVIKKSLKIVDKLIVATTDNIEKDYLFSLEERMEILNKCLFNDLRLSKNKIKIISFDDLPLNNLIFFDINLMHFPNFVPKIIS